MLIILPLALRQVPVQVLVQAVHSPPPHRHLHRRRQALLRAVQVAAVRAAHQALPLPHRAVAAQVHLPRRVLRPHLQVVRPAQARRHRPAPAQVPVRQALVHPAAVAAVLLHPAVRAAHPVRPLRQALVLRAHRQAAARLHPVRAAPAQVAAPAPVQALRRHHPAAVAAARLLRAPHLLQAAPQVAHHHLLHRRAVQALPPLAQALLHPVLQAAAVPAHPVPLQAAQARHHLQAPAPVQVLVQAVHHPLRHPLLLRQVAVPVLRRPVVAVRAAQVPQAPQAPAVAPAARHLLHLLRHRRLVPAQAVHLLLQAAALVHLPVHRLPVRLLLRAVLVQAPVLPVALQAAAVPVLRRHPQAPQVLAQAVHHPAPHLLHQVQAVARHRHRVRAPAHLRVAALRRLLPQAVAAPAVQAPVLPVRAAAVPPPHHPVRLHRHPPVRVRAQVVVHPLLRQVLRLLHPALALLQAVHLLLLHRRPAPPVAALLRVRAPHQVPQAPVVVAAQAAARLQVVVHLHRRQAVAQVRHHHPPALALRQVHRRRVQAAHLRHLHLLQVQVALLRQVQVVVAVRAAAHQVQVLQAVVLHRHRLVPLQAQAVHQAFLSRHQVVAAPAVVRPAVAVHRVLLHHQAPAALALLLPVQAAAPARRAAVALLLRAAAVPVVLHLRVALHPVPVQVHRPYRPAAVHRHHRPSLPPAPAFRRPHPFLSESLSISSIWIMTEN